MRNMMMLFRVCRLCVSMFIRGCKCIVRMDNCLTASKLPKNTTIPKGNISVLGYEKL